MIEGWVQYVSNHRPFRVFETVPEMRQTWNIRETSKDHQHNRFQTRFQHVKNQTILFRVYHEPPQNRSQLMPSNLQSETQNNKVQTQHSTNKNITQNNITITLHYITKAT